MRRLRRRPRDHAEAGGPHIDKPLVVLLQGPVGPFFGRLQAHLRRTGYRVVKINFNTADWWFSGRRNAINFRGDEAEWERWFGEFVEGARPDCILYFGSQRPIHRIARRLADANRIPAFSFEEGYVRPGFITMERNGNNAASPLAGRDSALLTPVDPADLPKPSPVSGFSAMCAYAAAYYILRSIGLPFYGATTFHRDRPLFQEAVRWARNFLRKLRHRSRNRAAVERLLTEQRGRYFLVALQVHDDLQIRRHGRGWTNERLILAALASFERCAPAEARLVFKVHPLDRGHFPYRRFIRHQAQVFGCENRIAILDDGPMGQLIQHARGLLTINSTSGISALFHGTPLLILGDALFRHADLASCGDGVDDIDRFWTDAAAGDADKVRNFLDHVRAEALIPGCYYSRTWSQDMLAAIVRRMEQAGLAARIRRRQLAVIVGRSAAKAAAGAGPESRGGERPFAARQRD